MFYKNNHNPTDDGYGQTPKQQDIPVENADPVFKIFFDAAIMTAHRNEHPIITKGFTVKWDGVHRGYGRYAVDLCCPVCGHILSIDTGLNGEHITGSALKNECNFQENYQYFATHHADFTRDQLHRVFSTIKDSETSWVNYLLDYLGWEYNTVCVSNYDQILIEHGFSPDIDLCEIDDDPAIDFNTDCLFFYPDTIELDQSFVEKFFMSDTVAVVRINSEYTGFHYEWLNEQEYNEFKSRII